MNADVFCTGKRAFRSFAEASESASKTAHRAGAKFRPYRCAACGMYHYGQIDGRRTPRAQMQRRRQHNYETEE